MKKLILITLLFQSFSAITQVNYQLGQNLTVGNKQKAYEVIYADVIGEYYSDYRKLGTETFLKIGAYTPWDTTRFSVKYTLELGLKYYQFFGTAKHRQTNLDDFPSLYGASNINVREVSWKNGVDFIYRINKKYTLINTLGVKVAIPNRVKEEKLTGIGRRLYPETSTENIPFINPLISIDVSPQLLMHFDGWSLGLHLNQNAFIVNNVFNRFNDSPTNLGKMQLSTFTSFGFSFMPNFYLKQKQVIVEEY